MKKCSKCKIEKPEALFNFKNKSKGIINSQCKDCTRVQIQQHYLNNKKYYLNKAHKRNEVFRNEINTYIFQYLMRHPCVDCGETDPVVLEFDHTGKKPKIKVVSRLIRFQVPKSEIELEIAKCVVRCANCRRRKTAKDFKWFKDSMPL